MSDRPVGHRPEAGLSDWTEQDLLTRQEALPRIEEAITEVEAEYRAEPEGRSRDEIGDRLAAMHAVRDRLLTS